MVAESDPGRPHLQVSFPSGSQVYVDQPISISCSTSGHILVWESSEYIGLGGQLSFVLGEPQGHKINSQINDHTFATLTSNQPELTSQLNLIVASNYPTFTIVCRNVEQGSTENVTYTISGRYNFPLFMKSCGGHNYNYFSRKWGYTIICPFTSKFLSRRWPKDWLYSKKYICTSVKHWLF